MSSKDITSCRGTLEFLDAENELLTVKSKVDPIYEISGVHKALENGPALLFENIKGYPGVRFVGNIFSRIERVARLFDVADHRRLKLKCREALHQPLPPKVVAKGPCQEVVITEDIDLLQTLPVLQYTEWDCGRIFGGNVALVTGKYFRNGTHVGFHRMHFRGKDWSTMTMTMGGHLEWAVLEHKAEGKIPLTVNIGAPPAVVLMAATGGVYSVLPVGVDEVGIAGALQGSPVEIVKAKTVDAYAIAQSEWVLEGYIDTTRTAWESAEADKIGEENVAPFFPEYQGHMGVARRTYVFQVTAITHRQDRPIFFSPLAHSYDSFNMMKPFREASLLEVAERMRPGFVVDVNALYAQRGFDGIVFQVRKRRKRDEGYQRNLLALAMAAAPGIATVIVVDDDVDIYSAEDVLWAITHRVNTATGVIKGIAGRGLDWLPMEKGATSAQEHHEGALAIDATVPFGSDWLFRRPKHPVDKINLSKWFSAEQIASARALQSEYARLMAQRGD